MVSPADPARSGGGSGPAPLIRRSDCAAASRSSRSVRHGDGAPPGGAPPGGGSFCPPARWTPPAPSCAALSPAGSCVPPLAPGCAAPSPRAMSRAPAAAAQASARRSIAGK